MLAGLCVAAEIGYGFTKTLFTAMLCASMQRFAILGSHPELSLAELQVVTGAVSTDHAGIVAIFDHIEGQADVLADRLGGTQKIGNVIGELPGSVDEKTLVEFLATQLEYEHRESKQHFGISVYDFGNPKKVDELAAMARKLGLSVKTALKARNISSRFVMAKEAALSAVSVRKNELITKGAEFVLLAAPGRIVVGTTEAVQDAEAWSARDFGRPRRNAKQGMLPPKLARMMVNMTGVGLHGATIMDPFCGSGTVLMEAALMGCQKVVGSDIASGAIHDTRENLSWMNRSGIPMPPMDLYVSKAADIGTHVAPNSVDAVVTETYLGNPRQGNETIVEVQEAVAYIETLYRESFRGMKNTLKGGAAVLIAAPVHFLGNTTYAPDVETIMTGLGYTSSPLPNSPITYHREGQLVGRRFFRFTV